MYTHKLQAYNVQNDVTKRMDWYTILQGKQKYNIKREIPVSCDVRDLSRSSSVVPVTEYEQRV